MQVTDQLSTVTKPTVLEKVCQSHVSTSIALVIFSKGVSFIPFPTITLDKEASSFNTHKTLLLATVRVPVLVKALAVKHPKPC